MKKLIAGVSALFLSGPAVAGVIHQSGDGFAYDAGPAAHALGGIAITGDPKLHRALVDMEMKQAMARYAKEQKTDKRDHSKWATGKWGGDTWSGVGGPREDAMIWPACRRGPGDDRCIQLYERGVRDSFAQWKASGTETGMGGPDEALGDKQMSGVSMAEESLLPKDPTLAPMTMSMAHAADASDKPMAMMMEHPQAAWVRPNAPMEPIGVGGPEEEPRVYPRCRSRSDDRCQQRS